MNKLPTDAREQKEIGAALLCLSSHGWMCVAPGEVDPFDLKEAAKSLIESVEGYVCPKKGDKYVFRGEVLAKCNKLKQLLNETD